ncbi:hypothetical protein APHCRT_0365 [Anaplasma phagocytophilum str. CRT53-1]|uniref:Uncharacterized protein n=1 Tax=Anaplasma phagocytophilum str. CRT53-1 TaxID=1359157 RepID=A0A0F3Q4S4_ANAPH|nr:hypothetical protein P030_02790 [Anaplasma phagocytophilum str. CRT35]KJV87523.1 hypothetical protein APHCRT_0365 [Anaplasma phagocytophilum str. CRT53-1]
MLLEPQVMDIMQLFYAMEEGMQCNYKTSLATLECCIPKKIALHKHKSSYKIRLELSHAKEK